MGSESLCRVDLDGTFAEAKALLETEEVVVRSPFRIKVPFRELTRVEADADALVLQWPGHRLRLEIGREAQKWADKIRNPKSVADKIGVKDGHRIALIGTIAGSFVNDLKRKGADVSTRVRAGCDLIFLAANRTADMDRLKALQTSLASDGAIWVIRPRGSQEISEKHVMAAGKRAGLVDVKVVRFSDTHTAEKLVIPVTRRGPTPKRG